MRVTSVSSTSVRGRGVPLVRFKFGVEVSYLVISLPERFTAVTLFTVMSNATSPEPYEKEESANRA